METDIICVWKREDDNISLFKMNVLYVLPEIYGKKFANAWLVLIRLSFPIEYQEQYFLRRIMKSWKKNLGLINYEKMKQWIKFKFLCFGSNIRKLIFLYCNDQERFAAWNCPGTVFCQLEDQN